MEMETNMTKEYLLRLKASILALIMCLSLNACSSTENNTQEENSNDNKQEEQVDDTMHLIAFVEGKAYIYEDSVAASTTIRDGGYAKIYEEGNYMYFLQMPTLILRGKDNAIKFASSVVGEENITFISWSDVKESELILTPNN